MGGCCEGCKCEGKDAKSPAEEVKAMLLEAVSSLACASIELDGVAEVLMRADDDADKLLAAAYSGEVGHIATLLDGFIDELQRIAQDTGL